jgi:hypothetical protein
MLQEVLIINRTHVRQNIYAPVNVNSQPRALSGDWIFLFMWSHILSMHCLINSYQNDITVVDKFWNFRVYSHIKS